jgi:hypothetical protein
MPKSWTELRLGLKYLKSGHSIISDFQSSCGMEPVCPLKCTMESEISFIVPRCNVMPIEKVSPFAGSQGEGFRIAH